MTVLYFYKMNKGDRFVLSKGHASPALYSCLYKKGIIDDISGFRNINSDLQGHPSVHTNGVEVATGSLGQGLSISVGMALGKKLKGESDKVYVILGDGEMQEGQVWEALLSASKFKLDNLTIIIDCNNVQLDGYVTDIKNIYPLDKKLKGFDLDVIEINGHKYEDIIDSLDIKSDKTKVILAKTIKGKGISFMENNHAWHGKAPNIDEYEKAIKELEEN